MNEVLFEALKLIVMVTMLVITRYLIPLVKEKISTNKLEIVEKWTRYAVLKAQQVLWAKDGAKRKAYVTQFLKDILIAKNISLTDEQIDILIEAAVKQMKIAEKQ